MNYIERIQKTIDYIEENISDNITLEDLANKAYCSKFHYHRIFQALVGEPVIQYMRKRKLTSAAQQLLNSSKKVTEIAFDFGFNSQAAFDRSFKNYYGITPREFRKKNIPIDLSEKIDLTGKKFDTDNACSIIGPKIIEIPHLKVVGMLLRETFDDNYHHRTVSKFWGEFILRESEIKNKINPNFGYGISFEGDFKNYFNYLASFKVKDFSEIPKGMVYKEVPSCKYAAFTYKGVLDMDRFYRAVNYIYGYWLQNSKYELAEGVHSIEAIRDVFSEEIDFDICVPIK